MTVRPSLAAAALLFSLAAHAHGNDTRDPGEPLSRKNVEVLVGLNETLVTGGKVASSHLVGDAVAQQLRTLGVIQVEQAYPRADGTVAVSDEKRARFDVVIQGTITVTREGARSGARVELSLVDGHGNALAQSSLKMDPSPAVMDQVVSQFAEMIAKASAKVVDAFIQKANAKK